jgi:hypothetical protein
MIPRETRPIRLALKTAQILADNVGAEKANIKPKRGFLLWKGGPVQP